MGTGKTCTAVAVAEQFIKSRRLEKQRGLFPTTAVKSVVVLTKGSRLHRNFTHEVAHVCTQGQYLEGLDKYTNRNRRIGKNVKANYTFNTFEKFAKTLKDMSDRAKTTEYEHTLFIVDEAHNLKTSSENQEVNSYREIAGLFDLLNNKKVLLLTGTPMKDKPEEIIDLFNLILKDKLTLDDLGNEEAFKRKIAGYVSYLRAMMSDVHKIEEGQLLGDLKQLNIYPVVMDTFQSNIYKLAKQKDDEERSIFNHSRQAAALVYPDKSYGEHGFKKNIDKTSDGHRFSNPRVRRELQQNLRKYSAKYADLLEKLRSDYSNGRLSFVFSEFVEGSGLVVLCLLLELNGYERATSSSNLFSKRKRYTLLTAQSSTDSQTINLLSTFNNPKNANGEYISTILGSRVIMEGFSFKNIQSEYILTPHWNYSETSQIIARGLRLGSHNDLIQLGLVPEVRVYQYAALPDDGPRDSIDLHMYEVSEKKDFQIQKVVRTIKEAAFDCALTKDRNVVTDERMDNTRGCEYTRCAYKCDNSRDIGSNNRNYRLLYFKSSSAYSDLKQFIVRNVIVQPFTIEDVMEQTSHSEFEIMIVLQDLLNFKEVLFTRPEGSYYLSNIRNLYYASTNTVVSDEIEMQSEDDPTLLNFYNKYTTIFRGKSMDELIHDNQKNYMVSLIDHIFASKRLSELQKYTVQLPLYLQEKLLCYSLSAKHKTTPNNFVRDMVLNNYQLYYRITRSGTFVWLNSDHYKCNLTLENYNTWRTCNLVEQEEIEKIRENKASKKSQNNPYGYIGLENKITNDFCLKKVDGGGDDQSDKRKRNVGRRCQNIKKKELVDLVANRLKVEPDEDFEFDQSNVDMMAANPRFEDLLNDNGTLKDYKRVAFWDVQDINYICGKIMANLKEKELMIDDPNCGTSRKIR